jgi:peptidoglycan/LPS O-acetylase OafA/YrhL
VTSFSGMTSQAPRRPVFAISGWLMLVLLFLPTLRVCNDPTAPIEFPPAYFIYVGSIVAAIGAWSRSRRTRHVVVVVLFALWIVALDLIAVGVIAGGNVMIGAIAACSLLAGTIAAVWMLARAHTGRRAFSGLVLGHALVATAWYAMLASDPEAMYGAYVGLAVASTMLIAAVVATVREAIVRAGERPARLPVARMLRG